MRHFPLVLVIICTQLCFQETTIDKGNAGVTLDPEANVRISFMWSLITDQVPQHFLHIIVSAKKISSRFVKIFFSSWTLFSIYSGWQGGSRASRILWWPGIWGWPMIMWLIWLWRLWLIFAQILMWGIWGWKCDSFDCEGYDSDD